MSDSSREGLRLLEKYRNSRKADDRYDCLVLAADYVKTDKDALQIGIEGLTDRAKQGRYLACQLLAWSLDRSVLPTLYEAANNCKDQETLDNIKAAIDAIEHQNSNYYVDRKHTGKITLKYV